MSRHVDFLRLLERKRDGEERGRKGRVLCVLYGVGAYGLLEEIRGCFEVGERPPRQADTVIEICD